MGEKLGHVRIDKLSKPMIAAYVKDRIRDKLSLRTASLDVIILRNVLKTALNFCSSRFAERVATKPCKSNGATWTSPTALCA